MGRERLSYLMAPFIRGSGRMTRCRGRGDIRGRMGKSMTATGSTTKSTAMQSIPGPTVPNSLASMKTIKGMERVPRL